MNDLSALINWHTTRAAVAARLESFPYYLPVAPAWVHPHRPGLAVSPGVLAN